MAVLPSAPAWGIQFLDSRFRRPLHNLVSPVCSGEQRWDGAGEWCPKGRRHSVSPLVGTAPAPGGGTD